MSEITVNITIADRPYRLTILRDEEERVRQAAAIINDRIRTYAQSYAYKDRQDLLAMAALQYATSALQFESEVVFRDNHLTQKLIEMDELLTNHLKS